MVAIKYGLVFLALAATTGCNRSAAPPAVGPPTPVAVTVVKPEKRSVKRVVEQPGSIQAFEETVLYAKFPGYIQTLSADPAKASRTAYDKSIDIGSRVKARQVLAELSVPELDEDFKQKQALVRQSEAEVIQAKKAVAATTAGIASSKASVAEMKAGLSRTQANFDRWESEAARATKLVADGVIDRQSRDETVNQFKSAGAARAESLAKVASAEAAVAKAEADRDKATADVTASEAKLDVAKADVRRVEALRAYTRIKAPFDGVVTRRAANTGDFVQADGKHGLFAVARIDPVRVVVHVPEADAELVTVGQSMTFALQALPAANTSGAVTRTSWSLEPGSRTLRTEVDLPNADGKIRPGMYVTAKLTVEMPDAWSVPAAAVGKVNDENVIYLAENDKAVRVAVQLLRGDGQYTQLKRYKRGSEWIEIVGSESVVSPASAVTDGQKLK